MEDEKPTLVMPAWIASIQVRKDASGDIRVDPHPSLSRKAGEGKKRNGSKNSLAHSDGRG